MTIDMSPTRAFTFAILVLAVPARADDGKTPDGVLRAYTKLSGAIETATMPDFMSVFHRDYLFEGIDGAGTDRGPWRRLWLDRFVERRYERVAYQVGEVLFRDEDQVAVATRRVIISSRKDGDGPRLLEEMDLEDTWFKPEEEGGDWTLINRVQTRLRTKGTLPDNDETPLSPRLAALAAVSDDEGRVKAFWSEVEKSGTPLVEATRKVSKRLVTFLWRGGGGERSIRVEGGLPDPGSAGKPLERLGDTNVWFRSETISADASFTYGFRLEIAVRVPASGGRRARTAIVSSFSTDPLNDNKSGGESLVELPGAASANPGAAIEGRPAGEVKRHTIASEILDERRYVSVYTPPNFQLTSESLPAVYLLDRGDYESRRATGAVLDGLIAQTKLPPTVVLMIHGEGSRSRALSRSEALVKFIGEELVPWANETFHVWPGKAVIGGNRIGGELAILTAAGYPKAFRGVLVQSATASDAATRLAGIEKLPLRFFLATGDLDPGLTVGAMRHLHDVLAVKGYEVTSSRYAGSQHAKSWHVTLARGLETLMR